MGTSLEECGDLRSESPAFGKGLSLADLVSSVAVGFPCFCCGCSLLDGAHRASAESESTDLCWCPRCGAEVSHQAGVAPSEGQLAPVIYENMAA